jgi:23S rRNA pseudouridine2457 synthase
LIFLISFFFIHPADYNVNMPKKLVYIALNKPDEVLCQFTDAHGRKTLKDFVPLQGIYSIGRLDYHSEGLLLLSNDGLFIHKVSNPRFHQTKTYLAQVEGLASPETISRLNESVLLPDFQTVLPKVIQVSEPDIPTRPRPIRGYHPTSWLKITLTEGKKHLVRRLTAAVGLPTLRLMRVAIGDIELTNLPPGNWRPLTSAEIRSLISAPVAQSKGRSD